MQKTPRKRVGIDNTILSKLIEATKTDISNHNKEERGSPSLTPLEEGKNHAKHPLIRTEKKLDSTQFLTR